MILKIYSVRDYAVAGFMQPFFSQTNAAAIRALGEAVNDPKSALHAHATDYTLWHIGDFDDATGVITPAGPERLIACLDLINKM